MLHTSSRILSAWVLMLLAAPVLAQTPVRAQFTTEDGVKIVADYWSPASPSEPGPAVILLHMYRSDRKSWAPLIPHLRKAGLAVLALDMRGHGESTQPASMTLRQRVIDRDATLFNAMHHDVAAAIKWLSGRKEVESQRIAVVGASVGCSVALDAARRDRRIKLAVLMTPGEKYLGVDSMSHITEYGARPILILSSQEELDVGALPLAGRLSSKVVARYHARSGDGQSVAGKFFSDSSRGADITLGVFGKPSIHGTNMFGEVAVEQPIADYVAGHITGARSSDITP